MLKPTQKGSFAALTLLFVLSESGGRVHLLVAEDVRLGIQPDPRYVDSVHFLQIFCRRHVVVRHE